MNRTGLSPADIAESFRDRCGDGSVEWVYTPTQTWVLLDAADMLDENDKLRNEFRKMDEWHSKELVAAMDENAKLRELVRDYDKVLDAAVDVWGIMADVLGYGRKYDALHARMRELGVDA